MIKYELTRPQLMKLYDLYNEYRAANEYKYDKNSFEKFVGEKLSNGGKCVEVFPYETGCIYFNTDVDMNWFILKYL